MAPRASATRERERLIAALEKMHDTQGWKEALKANGWTDAFRPVTSSRPSSRSRTSASPTPSASWVWLMSTTGHERRTGSRPLRAGGLPSCSAWSAAVVIVDAVAARRAVLAVATRSGPARCRSWSAGCCWSCAVALAVDVLRGGHGEAEEGEDIDLDGAPPSGGSCFLLVGAFVANILLIDVLGWVISGADPVLGLRLGAGQPAPGP